MFQKIDALMSMPDLKQKWEVRRQKMLSEKIDYSCFLAWFIENYPKSKKIMQDTPEYQFRFK
jgi:hypothetical protein